MTLVNITRTPPTPTASIEISEWNRKHPPGTHVSVRVAEGEWMPVGPTAGPAFIRDGQAMVVVGNTPWLLRTLRTTQPEAIDLEKAADERAVAPPSPLFVQATEAHRILAEFDRSRDALRAAEADYVLARESLGRLVDQFGAKTGSQALMVIGSRAISVYPEAGRRNVEVADCVIVPR